MPLASRAPRRSLLCALSALCGLFLTLFHDRLPVQHDVPHEAVVSAVQIAMERVEVERHDMAAPDWYVEDRGAADQKILSPRLTTDDEWFIASPLHDDRRPVERAIEARGAVRHPEPAPWYVVQRKILAEHVRMRRITVCDRRIGLVERHADVRAGRTGLRIFRRAAARRRARHAAGRPANAANDPAFEREHRSAAERDHDAAALDEPLNFRQTLPSDPAGD